MEEAKQLKFKSVKEKEEFIKENAEKLHMTDFKDVEFSSLSSDKPIDIYRTVSAFYYSLSSEERRTFHDMLRIHNQDCISKAVKRIAALIVISTAILSFMILKLG